MSPSWIHTKNLVSYCLFVVCLLFVCLFVSCDSSEQLLFMDGSWMRLFLLCTPSWCMDDQPLFSLVLSVWLCAIIEESCNKSETVADPYRSSHVLFLSFHRLLSRSSFSFGCFLWKDASMGVKKPIKKDKSKGTTMVRREASLQKVRQDVFDGLVEWYIVHQARFNKA